MRDLELIRTYRQDVEDDTAAQDAARERLRARILATRDAGAGRAAADRRRRNRRRRAGVSIVALFAICGTATAASVLLNSDDIHLGSVACLSSAGTIEDHTGSAVFLEPTADPVTACASVWREGNIPGREHVRAPQLVACASPGRPIVVIPGNAAACRDLGLDVLPGDYAPAAAAVRRAKAVLLRETDLHWPRSRCDDPNAALARGRALLDDAGLRNVPIDIAGDLPCAGPYQFDRGALAQVETLSRKDANDAHERELIDAALQPLNASVGCRDPLHAARRARELLRDAGLAHVNVRIDPHGGPCLMPGTYDYGDHNDVTLRRETRDKATDTTRRNG